MDRAVVTKGNEKEQHNNNKVHPKSIKEESMGCRNK